MITVSSIDYISPAPCVLALGCFDGVHRGHEAVIRRAREIADKHGLPLAVWSFQTPPKNFFVPNAVPLITTVEEKASLIEALGADVLLSIPFDKAVASIPYEEFFHEILCRRLSARHLVCGFDFTFGAKGLGNTDRLAALCHENGLSLSVVAPFGMDDEAVSSSRIREAIEAGDTEKTQNLLGRPYSITAEVIHGQHLARDLGFRTINQQIPREKAVPRHGVYVTRVAIGDKTHYGITNVGMRPTVGGTLLCSETHIFDYCEELYGTTPTISLLHFLRPETRFSSLDALVAQVNADIENAKVWLKNNK